MPGTVGTVVGRQGGAGDTPTSSDIVKPVGGHRRIGEPWYLVERSLSSVQMPEGVTLNFAADTVGGQAPFRAWSAEYPATDVGGLELRLIASTLIAGPEEAMRAEEGFFALLDTVDGCTAVEAGELSLFDEQAQVLACSATPQPGEPTLRDATIAVAEDLVGVSQK